MKPFPGYPPTLPQDLEESPAGKSRAAKRQLMKRSGRCFSVDDANEMLPLVRRITLEIMRLSGSRRHLAARLKFVTAEGEIEQMFPREIRAMRQRIDELDSRLEECLDELIGLGIEPELPSLGLVDFPSTVGARPAYLCWMHDEPAIAWWHHVTGGFVDRQPVREAASR